MMALISFQAEETGTHAEVLDLPRISLCLTVDAISACHILAALVILSAVDIDILVCSIYSTSVVCTVIWSCWTDLDFM